jgi:arylformamidase
MTKRLVDCSHTVAHGLVTYPGLPAPVVSTHLSREASRGTYAPGVEFHIGKIEMVANTGTYLDSPFHRFEGARDLSRLPLEWVADLPGVLVRHPSENGRAVEEDAFEGLELSGRAVLVATSWSKHFATPSYKDDAPFLTRGAAERLAAAGARLVGIDSINIDDMGDKARPAHSTLLAANVLIVEHMTNLEAVPESGFRFFAVPVKVQDFGTFPVRAFAIVG